MRKLSKILVLVLCLAFCSVGLWACKDNESQEPNVAYTVVFETGVQEKIEPIAVWSGDTIDKPTDPIKPNSETQEFSFIGWYYGSELWDFEKDIVVRDMVLVAHYQSSTIQCVVNFYDEDKTTLIESKTVDIGSSISIADPVKQSTGTLDYVFSKWLNVSDDKLASFENIRTSFDVYAVYESHTKTHKVTFYDYDKVTVLDFKKVGSGSSVEAITPVRDSDVKFEYTFDKWLNVKDNTQSDFSNITSDLEVYATYNETLRKYNVKWLNEGTEVEVDANVEYGSQVSFNGGEPEKGDLYFFVGWFESQELADNAQTAYKEALDISTETVSGEKTYYAGFAKMEVKSLSKPLFNEYGLGSEISLPTAKLTFLGKDVADDYEWQVKKSGNDVDLSDSDTFIMTEAGTYDVNIVKDEKVLVNYKIKSTLYNAFASANSEDTIITYNDGIAESYSAYKGMGLNIAAGDTVTINRVFMLDSAKMAENALVVNPNNGEYSKGYYMFVLGFDDLTSTEYKNKDFTLTIYDADDSAKYITIMFYVDSTGFLKTKTSYCGGEAVDGMFACVTPGRSQDGVGLNLKGAMTAFIYAEAEAIVMKSYSWKDKTPQIFNNDVFSGFEMFDSFTFAVSSSTGFDVDFAYINHQSSKDLPFYEKPRSAVTLSKPLFVEYALNTELTLPDIEIIVDDEDVSQYCGWKITKDSQQIDINDDKIVLDQTGEYKFLVVSGDAVLETYNVNVVDGTPTFASASSTNTTITYNDTANISQAEYADNCLGITIAAGDTVTLNREFTLGVGASSTASVSSYRLFAFSLEDWTRAEYVGKELLITVTSTTDSSKYFTILFKLGSTNIIALARYGGIAEDKIVNGKGLYDKKVYLRSDAGSEQEQNSSMVYIIAGSDGLHLRGQHSRTPADIFSTSTAGNEWSMSDFNEFIVTISSETGYELDFTQINNSHSWN